MASLPHKPLDTHIDRTDTLDDNRIIAGVVSGNQLVFESLYRKYYTPLVEFAAYYVPGWDEAEEIVQDVFIRIWSKRETLGENVTSLKSYLYGSVRNGALNRTKHITRITRIHASASAQGIPLGSAASTDPGALESIERKERDARLNRELSRLPERQNAALLLYYEHGMSFVEIGRTLEISDVAARKLVNKAEKRLKEALKEE